MLEKRAIVTYEHARELILNQIEKLGSEVVALNEADGRMLAEPVFAPFPFPMFRRSGYDGYAICAEDDAHYPITLKVVGEVPCGATYGRRLQTGETVRIMTGAKVPENGAKIIMLEQAEQVDKDRVTLLNTQKTSNITEVGAEIAQGDLLLDRFHEMNAGSISFLAAFGVSQVAVIRRPRVAVFSTGSELVTPGESLPDGKIYNSNQPLLRTLVEEAGGVIVREAQLPDDYALTLETLREAAGTCDLILTTGGVSVGDFDYMALIGKNEAELLFNKIKMRPGSPTTGMLFEGTPLIALSGNPGACFTGFYLFGEPALRKLAGGRSRVRKVKARMAADYLKNNGFDRFLRGCYELEEGTFRVTPVGSDMSSALANLAFADCLIRIPGGKTGKVAGEEVEAWLLSSK
ncbi:gephyrin-like molybdotransferase Glp [Listeria costaricensis]|uniref:molybdopterin molybdotransferase MoeA n=1 Tax=Listeria costaricensis TaxID=2026604 RepID=UPI000C087B98|nr:gephyrin-like molybdotransferase Glp [Listeria costaricensis]